jgi:signal transduction histidine kinase
MTDQRPLGGPPVPDSYFAPAGRATPEHIRELSERALADPILGVVFEAVSGYAMVMDRHRQIIAGNAALLDMLGTKAADSVLGLRPGEALHCVNAKRGPDGCGTSIQCRHCGAVAAILAAQVDDQPMDGQCSLACCDDEHLKPIEFRIRVSPLLLADERVYVFVFQDVTSTKRRELLERMFLHDLGNLLTGLLGWSEELSRTPAADAATQVIDLAQRIGEQLDDQRLLVHCEAGELKLTPERIDFDALIASLRAWFGAHACAEGRHFTVEMAATSGMLRTDRQLLLRVLGNLLKNAFEATEVGGLVTLRVTASTTSSVFEIHNTGVIPHEIARQLFKQRLSSKGPARGLGIYAVQLLGEQCLGGQISFESSAERGTAFRFELPSGIVGA